MRGISPRATRRLLGAAILGFWLVMVGLLVSRQVRESALAAAGGRSTAAPPAAERWLAVEAGGRRIGVLHVASGPQVQGGTAGAALRLDAELRVRVLETPTELRVAGRLWRTLDGRKGTVALDVVSGEHAVRIEGTVDDGVLRGTLNTAGAAIPLHARIGALPMDEGALLSLAPGGRLRPGQERAFETIDPFTLQPAPARVRCLREETVAVGGSRVAARVVEVEVGTATVTAWLDAAGEVVQADVPFGIRLRRISRAEAFFSPPSSDLPDLVTALDIKPTGVTPRRGARRMAVRVSGVPASLLPTDQTQSLAADGTSLVVVAPAGGDSARPSEGADAKTAALFLACTPLVQCDQPAIRERADAIVRGELDPWRRAVLLERWVNRNLTKRPVPALPSALDVLATREGDCTEHTVLFTALARAVGLPTRMAAGLVWSDEVGAFAYHAWPEVYVGRWVWTDPTLGQEVADATHIELATGSVEDWRLVTAFLGSLRIELEEDE